LASLKRTCFFIMPFSPELNYFYLYVSDHIRRRFGFESSRADQRYASESMREKILAQIREANIIIADCTGENPNVFYETGYAHALNKDVILITQGRRRDAPTDINPLHILKYDLSQHQQFLADLDNAIDNLLVARYDRLYGEAIKLFHQYKSETNSSARPVTREAFITVIQSAEQSESIPAPEDVIAFAGSVLPKIVARSADATVMSSINEWVDTLH